MYYVGGLGRIWGMGCKRGVEQRGDRSPLRLLSSVLPLRDLRAHSLPLSGQKIGRADGQLKERGRRTDRRTNTVTGARAVCALPTAWRAAWRRATTGLFMPPWRMVRCATPTPTTVEAAVHFLRVGISY